eukprot:scaffold160737_cov35-Prasinocladus_malaysianus.AAC.1
MALLARARGRIEGLRLNQLSYLAPIPNALAYFKTMLNKVALSATSGLTAGRRLSSYAMKNLSSQQTRQD